MASNFYSVVITRFEAAAPRDGFIDPQTVYQYMAGGSIPTTLALSTAKSRANARWKLVLQKILVMATIQTSNIATPGGTANAAPTSLTFWVEIEPGDIYLRTEDETSPGTFLTESAALKRAVARAMIYNDVDNNGEIYDPTTVVAPGNSTPAVRTGAKFVKYDIGNVSVDLATAEALITVTKLI